MASPGDFEAVQAIAREVRGPVIAALARAIEPDIVRAAQALEPAEKPRIHTFIATSPIHMKYKLRKTPEEVLEMAVEAVGWRRSTWTTWSFPPRTRPAATGISCAGCSQAAIEAGATTINIPDTVGTPRPTSSPA